MIFNCEKCGQFDDPEKLVFEQMGDGRLEATEHSCGGRLIERVRVDGVVLTPLEGKILEFPKERWNG